MIYLLYENAKQQRRGRLTAFIADLPAMRAVADISAVGAVNRPLQIYDVPLISQ
ncbi:MAG TPA: hypothetical protein VKR42_01340 [Ktedonobacteraceae bacterium]|nr:hypothetical protein [Ktedonobacteraceae bacterium]